LGTNPWIEQPMCCRLCCEPFFSGVVTLSNSVDDSQNVAICESREIRMVEGHMRTGCEECVVLIIFSPVGCTSIQITVTLGYE
jgi:hypothetical protein